MFQYSVNGSSDVMVKRAGRLPHRLVCPSSNPLSVAMEEGEREGEGEGEVQESLK